MSSEGFTSRESILQSLVHAERRMRDASEAHDIEAVAIAGSYLQGWQDSLNALIGIPETKTLFRSARRVVEQDAQFATQRGFAPIEAIVILAACACVAMLSGCAGVELGGRLGVYRVDERQESQHTYNKPWKCLFVNCAESNESQGS